MRCKRPLCLTYAMIPAIAAPDVYHQVRWVHGVVADKNQ